jgi:two-component system NtrC family sensor kinase
VSSSQKNAAAAGLLEGSGPHVDEAFQKLLLRFSTAAAQGTDASSLIQLFCRSTREFFQVHGVYFWRLDSRQELVGAEADGYMDSAFKGMQLRAGQNSVPSQAVRTRRTVCVNRLTPEQDPLGDLYNARSLMAIPLIVCNEVIGAAAFVHQSDAEFFNADLGAKATILAGQLGSLMEASRVMHASREENLRAEILVEVAHALHAVPDTPAVIEALADRIRILLQSRIVCILLRQETGAFHLQVVSAETPDLVFSVRSRHDRKTLHFASDLATRAVTAGEPITVAIDSATFALSDLVPAGTLLVAPLRTSRTEGAIFVYPRSVGPFTAEEKSLLAAIAAFGAMAVTNSELYAVARGQAYELHQLLEISSELGSIGQLDKFMQRFVMHGCSFLGFGRCFIALAEDGRFHVRWGADHGEAQPVDEFLPDGGAVQALSNGEVFWTDDPARTPGLNLEIIERYQVRQLLAVPLLGAQRDVLGMFGVLDQLDHEPISPEDIRRARALAAQVAVALEATRNLHLSEQHRHRAESLMGLAMELSSQLELSEFARNFVSRAADMMGARAAGLAVSQDDSLELIALQDVSLSQVSSEVVQRHLARALSALDYAALPPVMTAPAHEVLGARLSSVLDWSSCTLVRLTGVAGDLLGVLCLADCCAPSAGFDQQLLQAISGHASTALENARLFTRMDRANRHWMEIFDSISDFIVVHDEHGEVLRVNRSLADFIGVQPQELIGVNMRALLAMSTGSPLHSCPFCRSTGEGTDEYFHPALDHTYLVSTSRIHGASNEGMQVIHVLKDITDRREAERRYREVFDNVQEGLFFSTPGGRFIEVNDALVRLLGYKNREELLQVDIATEVYMSPGHRDAMRRILEQEGILRNYESVLRRKDGSPVHVLLNAFAVRDAKGQVQQFRGLIMDVSGVRNYQVELQRERDFSNKILNNTQSLILVADTSGLIRYANRRWFDLGYEQNDLLARPVEDLVTPVRRPSLRDALQTTLNGNQVDNLELQILRADGRIGQFSVNLSPMRDEEGVSSIVVVMTDVTDAVMLQAKLVHTEKMAAVGQLVSGVAHEVNNPLTAILGFADLLMENPEIPETARKDLRVILQEAQRTKQIVQNLLSFARQMPPQRKPLELNAILRRTVQLRAYDFHSHGIQVIEQLGEDLPHVIGDAHQLQQVFLNILNNAYDAVHEIGRPARIQIHTCTIGEFVEISFRDNGYGISHPDRIFDPFFTTKEVGKGTGLGLSICYGIVREHGGDIFCHNNAGDQGATFIVRLPAAPGATVPEFTGGER